MEIKLKEDEIVMALRNYITSSLGMSLQGKNMATSFTAGRGKSGISVDISIENDPRAVNAFAPSTGILRRVVEPSREFIDIPEPGGSLPIEENIPAAKKTVTDLIEEVTGEPAVVKPLKTFKDVEEDSTTVVEEEVISSPEVTTSSLFGKKTKSTE